MDAEELPVFLRDQGVTTMRAHQSERSCRVFTRRKSLTADFALILAVATIVIVYEVVRGTAHWTDDIFWDGFIIAALDWSEGGFRISIDSIREGSASPV